MRRTNHHSKGGGYDQGRPLSAGQKAKLNIIAKSAFDHQERLDLIDVEGDTPSERLKNWRRAQQKIAVGIESLTQCQNGHFRRLRAHFLALGGREDKAFNDLVKTGKVKDAGAIEDTHEAREMWRVKIREVLAEHERVVMQPKNAAEYQRGETVQRKGGLIRMEYAVSIAKRKWPKIAINNLTVPQIKIVFFELVNRIAAKEGRGNSKKRNMKQRQGRRREGGED